jgi:YbbR domain-containing protein
MPLFLKRDFVTSKRRAAWVLLFFCILALAGFFALWLLMCQETLRVVVPVVWPAAPQGWSLVPEGPQGVELTLSGPKWLLRKIAKNPPPFLPAPLPERPGLHTQAITEKGFDLPLAVKVESLHPGSISAQLFERAQKEFFVIVETAGQPVDGYTVTQLWVDPERVILAGPKSWIEEHSTAVTRKVELSGRRESFSVQAGLALPNLVKREGQGDPVVVTVEISQQNAVKWLRQVPIIAKHAPPGVVIQPGVIDLLVKGPVQSLDAFDERSGVLASMNLSGLGPGVYVRRASIVLPLELILLDASPEVFTVRIQ